MLEGAQEDDRYDNEVRDRRNGVFPIKGVEHNRDSHGSIIIGKHTPIQQYYTDDPEDGYSYNIEEGTDFVILVEKVGGKVCGDNSEVNKGNGWCTHYFCTYLKK